MDKKKVIELIENAKHLAILRKYENRQAYLNNCIHALKEALDELSKPDWISVEDELPPYGEVVLVVCETYPNVIWSTKRMDRFENGRTLDEHLFNTKEHLPIITHWRKIDKLEV